MTITSTLTTGEAKDIRFGGFKSQEVLLGKLNALDTEINLKEASTDVTTSLALKANKASPVITGTMTAAIANFSGAVDVDDALRANSLIVDGSITAPAEGIGAGNGTGVAATEAGNGLIQKTTLVLTAHTIAVTDANAYAGSKIYDFPEGHIFILGVTGNMSFAVTTDRASTINDSAAMDWGLGSVTASNSTLASTMIDMQAKVDHTLDGSTSDFTSLATSVDSTNVYFDGMSTATDMYLNVAFPTETEIDGDANLDVTGTLIVLWINLGDF